VESHVKIAPPVSPSLRNVKELAKEMNVIQNGIHNGHLALSMGQETGKARIRMLGNSPRNDQAMKPMSMA
jgi:hypothetical protein